MSRVQDSKCGALHKASIDCLNQHNGDRELCEEHVDAYKACVKLQNEIRRNIRNEDGSLVRRRKRPAKPRTAPPSDTAPASDTPPVGGSS